MLIYAPMSIRAMSLGFSFAVACALVGFDATAEEVAAGEAAACTLSDTTSPVPNAELYTAVSGGAPIAKFTGVLLAVRVSAFVSQLAGSRVRVETGDSKKPYLRIGGFTSPSSFRYFARENLAIVPGHVWLTKGLEFTPRGAKGAELEFEHAVLGTRTSDGGPLKLRASVPCGAVALLPPSMDSAEAPKGARWYHMKTDSVTIHDEARGKSVLELRMDADVRKVFWSTQTRADWVHVMAPGDVMIDGWVRAAELEPLIHAEVFDMNSLAPTPLVAPGLALAEPPKVLTSTTALPILAKADAAGLALGSVDVGATFFAMDVSTAWTSVVPTDLAIMPTDGSGFWVKTSTLPKP